MLAGLVQIPGRAGEELRGRLLVGRGPGCHVDHRVYALQCLGQTVPGDHVHAAGIAYAAAWVTGLAVWPSNLDVAASDARVVSAYSGHEGVAVTQYLLVEGLAAIALAVVVIALGRAARRRGAGHLINRLDGAKMLALAALGLAGVGVVRRTGLLPRWLGYNAALLAAAMVASGVGYMVLDNTVAQAAALSLPLLLVWVAATGVTLGHRSR